MGNFKSKVASVFYTVVAFVFEHKIVTSVSLLLVAAIIATVMILPASTNRPANGTSSDTSSLTAGTTSSEVVSDNSEDTAKDEDVTSSKDTESKKDTASDKSDEKDITSSESSGKDAESNKDTTSSKTDDKEVTSSEVSSKDTESKQDTASSKVDKDVTSSEVSSKDAESNKDTTSGKADDKDETSSKDTESKKENTSSKTSGKDTSSKKPGKDKGDKKDNTSNKDKTESNIYADMTPDNNVFLDALEYTGYQLDVQRNSGMMWGSFDNYILCSQKRGLGWLSDINYDDYGRASGYETNSKGKPDISYFEDTGLVCASYVTYVYFNYLPNVAGIDTSKLPRPNKSYAANDWYIAGKKWIDKGYSRYIDFSASDGGSIDNDINFTPEEDIPIGSLIVLCDWYNRSDWCSHICIYAGKMGGYHWVTHVGNENGPEFCAIERMNRKPHPQWPIAVITPPSNLKFSTKD